MNHQIKVDPMSLKGISCSCGCFHFSKIVTMRYLPAIQSPNGQAGVINVEGMVCVECGSSAAAAIESFEQQMKRDFESKIIDFKK